MTIILIYLVLINIFGIFIMYDDKKKARKGYWRISEQRLFLIALLFGSPGILIGMKLFRHKTRHFKFVYGIPLIFILQVFIVCKAVQFFY